MSWPTRPRPTSDSTRGAASTSRSGRAALPKPAPGHPDAAEAAEAALRWAGLKRDAAAAARLGARHLDAMLADARRVAPSLFWSGFAAHSLMRHLCAGLVWGLYPDDDPASGPLAAFRVSDGATPLDAEYAAVRADVSVGASGRIGLVHPLELDPARRVLWGDHLAEGEVHQVVPQLFRETFALTAAEAASTRVHRFRDAIVDKFKLRALERLGWRPDGGGLIPHSLDRDLPLPGGRLVACLSVDAASDPRNARLGDIDLRDPGGGDRPDRRFGELGAVAASELLRGPSLLAAGAI